MRDNLNLAHQQYRKGLIISGGGAVVLSAAVLAIKPNSDIQLIAGFLGGAVTILGGVLMIDSHRYIGKAGRWEFGINKVIVSLN